METARKKSTFDFRIDFELLDYQSRLIIAKRRFFDSQVDFLFFCFIIGDVHLLNRNSFSQMLHLTLLPWSVLQQ